MRRAQQVLGVDLRALVVEDRRLHGASQELVGMSAEKLVEGVLAGEKDRQPAPAPPRPAPHLAQARHGDGKGDTDRSVERADVDPELERVRGDHGEQLARGEPPLELAALLRRVAGAVGRDPSASSGCPELLRRSTVKRRMSSTPRRDFMKQIVRAPSSTRRSTSSAASARTEARRPSASSTSGGFHIATVRWAVGAASVSISVI